MGMRIYYLRDFNNLRLKDNGTLTRGNPRVCIVSQFDSKTGTVKYGIAATHPKDHFSKMLARRIAQARMENHQDQNAETEMARSGQLEIQVKTGHEINKAVIQHIFNNFQDGNTQVKKLARAWLERAEQPPSSKLLPSTSSLQLLPAEV